jgi:hypothetical protein
VTTDRAQNPFRLFSIKSDQGEGTSKLLFFRIRNGVKRRNRDSANLLESVYEAVRLPWREMRGGPTNLVNATPEED